MSGYQPYVAETTTSDPGIAYTQAPVSSALEPVGYGPNLSRSAPLPEHPSASVILVLGIFGLIMALVAPIAWIMGNKAKQQCDAGQYRMSDPLKYGRILGLIGTILLIAGVFFSTIFIIIFFYYSFQIY